MSAAKEKAVREAATALHAAIKDAVEAGLVVTWPARAADLDNIAVSAGGKAHPTVAVRVEGNVPPAAEAKAQVAAQKAVDRAIEADKK